MRVCTEQWTKLASRGRFWFDAKARINNKDYLAISAPRIDRSLMSSPLTVGNCTSATLNLSILTNDVFAAGQPVVIMGRLINDKTATEWKEFGTFYIDQRDTSFDGLVTIDCYDAMLKANQNYLTDDDLPVNWPKSMESVVEEIASRIGVGIDLRTRIKTGADYVVQYPSDKTMSQVLGYIGACHGGNWIITEENLLRLVPLTTAPDETYHVIDEDYNKITLADGTGNQLVRLAYKEQTIFNAVLPVPSGVLPGSSVQRSYFITDENGNKVVTPEGYYLVWDTDDNMAKKVSLQAGVINIPVVCGSITTGTQVTVTGVSISNDNGESYTAGDDTGTVLTIDSNPYATQGVCNDLYAAFNGLVYLPFTATKSLYDPAVELGDQVKIGEFVHSVMCSAKLTLDHNFRADIEAPNSEELSTEYPYLSETAKLQKQDEYLKSYTEKTAEAVSQITVQLNDISLSAVSENGGSYLHLSNGDNSSDVKLALSVSNSETESTITLTAGDVSIASETIKFNGYVTFDGLSGGTTTIDGACIKTGELNAETLRLTCDYGGFACAEGNDGTNITYGAMVYGSDPNYYLIATNAGVRMQTPNVNFCCSTHSIIASEAISVTSDRRKKNSISYDMDRYDQFFLALAPCYYKFNAGTSDRYHSGFIAQEVEAALTDNGLTNQDFAGLTIREVAETVDGKTVTQTEYALRYGEFIALNTHMIQKLYARITELENTINSLEARL